VARHQDQQRQSEADEEPPEQPAVTGTPRLHRHGAEAAAGVGRNERSGSSAMMRARSFSDRAAHWAISVSVRRHPTQRPDAGSIVQILTQGERTAAMDSCDSTAPAT
jgi:hypothetical protein